MKVFQLPSFPTKRSKHQFVLKWQPTFNFKVFFHLRQFQKKFGGVLSQKINFNSFVQIGEVIGFGIGAGLDPINKVPTWNLTNQISHVTNFNFSYWSIPA